MSFLVLTNTEKVGIENKDGTLIVSFYIER